VIPQTPEKFPFAHSGGSSERIVGCCGVTLCCAGVVFWIETPSASGVRSSREQILTHNTIFFFIDDPFFSLLNNVRDLFYKYFIVSLIKKSTFLCVIQTARSIESGYRCNIRINLNKYFFILLCLENIKSLF
jgi:hypothetical protein